MTQYLSQQRLLAMLFWAFVLGILLGAVYSLFGIRRAAFRKLHIPRIAGDIILHLEDFLFCIAGAVSLTVLYFATTNGVLRLMALPALLGGLLLWRLTAGRLVEACTDRILHLLAMICRWIAGRILFPIGRTLRRVWQRIWAKHLARRERRYFRKLASASRRMTRRYEAALVAAAGMGMLPTPDGRWQKSVKKKQNKRKLKNKRKKERSK